MTDDPAPKDRRLTPDELHALCYPGPTRSRVRAWPHPAGMLWLTLGDETVKLTVVRTLGGVAADGLTSVTLTLDPAMAAELGKELQAWADR